MASQVIGKNLGLLQMAIHYLVGRKWQETLALLFELPRFMVSGVYEKEIMKK